MCEWSPDPINADKTLLLFSSPLAWVNTVRWIFLILLAHSPTLELLCCGSNATRTHTHPLYTHTLHTNTCTVHTHARTHIHTDTAKKHTGRDIIQNKDMRAHIDTPLDTLTGTQSKWRWRGRYRNLRNETNTFLWPCEQPLIWNTAPVCSEKEPFKCQSL